MQKNFRGKFFYEKISKFSQANPLGQNLLAFRWPLLVLRRLSIWCHLRVIRVASARVAAEHQMERVGGTAHQIGDLSTNKKIK